MMSLAEKCLLAYILCRILAVDFLGTSVLPSSDSAFGRRSLKQ